ncbi:MAG: hypothetical protein L0Y79_10860 [Chlorobi bacterium]|nr:hypothetical protein [Chlorobiota bacterium]MCI0715557.1 hypothetical protein [Chlorobiota bacterium]
MKFNKKLLAPLVVSVFLLFAIGYAITTKFEPILNIFSSNLLDSLETDSLDNNPPPSINDVSQMFNERGYYKSNSFSFDENEIINDFNGNLIYEIPLYNYKLAGDLPFDVKLTYNGSVNHMIFLGSEFTYNNSAVPNRYNVNAPEWILSVNGIAVQVLNFETNFFCSTSVSSVNTIAGDSLHLLIPGYHINDRLVPAQLADKDRINFLMGDGSVITLINTSTTSLYTGIYIYEGKELYYKANVTFMEPEGEDNSYRNRRVELMKGDGLVYVFEEHKMNFADFNVIQSTINSRRKPQLFLLKEIIDQFGNQIFFNYDGIPVGKQTYPYSRPLLSHIGTRVGFINAYYGQLAVRFEGYSSINGPYTLTFPTPVEYDPVNQSTGNKNHRGMVTNIKNINGQNAVIFYENYTRTFTNTQNPLNQSVLLTLNFNTLKRISGFRNFLGGKRGYKYLDGSNNTISIDLINYDPSGNAISSATNSECSENSTYKGYGRDAFFTNMITERRDTNTVEKSLQTFGYYYECGSRSDYLSKPVDSTDKYRTVRIVESKDGSTVNSSDDYIKYEKFYRVYPLPLTEQPIGDKIDISGVTKLLRDSVLNESNSWQMVNIYRYELGSKVNTGFTGSFLMTKKTNNYPNLSNPRIWTYEHTYLSSNYDNPVEWTRETDPKSIKFETSYDYFLSPINYFNEQTFTNTTMYYYKIGIPKLEERFDGSTKIYKKEYIYIHDSSMSIGYFGQLDSVRLYNAAGFSSYILTRYEYYKRDTLGLALHLDVANTDSRPRVEGNLKKIINPDGEEEHYFYYPILLAENTFDPGGNPQDAPPHPRVSFKIKYTNGTVRDTSLPLRDSRLPIRIDNYKNTGSGMDTLKRIYMSYNEAGSPTKILNEHKYLTELIYQPTHRIRSITLPGDFSTTPNSVSLIIHRDSAQFSALLYSNAWGHLNHSDNDSVSYTQSPFVLSQVNCGMFYMDHNNIGDHDEYDAFIKFDGDALPKFMNIDSAIFIMKPIKYVSVIAGDSTPNDYTLRLTPVSGIGNISVQRSCNSGVYFSKNKITKENSYTNIDISINNSVCDYYVNKYNIGSMLSDLMITNNKKLKGLLLYPHFEFAINGEPTFNCYTWFTYCGTFPTNYQIWGANHVPTLSIYGKIDISDTLYIPIIYGGTYIYTYDDNNSKVTVESVMRHDPGGQRKKVTYRIDGFGNIKQKDIYTSSTAYDSLLYNFNFLNKLAINVDGKNNQTKFSYDVLERMNKTTNADNSNSIVAYSYLNSISSYMGGSSYSGFVEMQTFYDETGRQFNKYFDAIGNLLREEKFVAGDSSGNIQHEDNPFDLDTTYEGQDLPPQTVTLRTDYQYDKLNRLIKVITPDSSVIDYWYDGYGRQSMRKTPDAGFTKYGYDNNNNLITSQDANQWTQAANLYTRRSYDGLNRLLTIGDIKYGGGGGQETGPMGDTLLPIEFDFPPNADSTYVINVYDTISTAVISGVFTSLPSGYTASNFTKGNLVATAYRTRLSDGWGFKFYRYDQRGRVVKFWHKLDGLGWKSENYTYNSQNQVTRNSYQVGLYDGNVFSYLYDDAGRLASTSLYVGSSPDNPDEEGDSPTDYWNLTKYSYNQNSQVATHKLNIERYTITYVYNNRNWIQQTNYSSGTNTFRYVLLYNPNGNIRYQDVQGDYADNFAVTGFRRNVYIYDESNRLLKANEILMTDSNSYDVINGYDKDGNLKVLKRYGSSNNLVDNFAYEYFSGTNKLKKVSSGAPGDDYSFDANGNLKTDEINKNYSILYDYRNLMTDIRTIRQTGGIPAEATYWTRYWYDEAGNRIRKQKWQYNGSDPDPIFNEDSPTNWQLTLQEFYVRDVSGKEIAIFSDTTLQRWNFWGLDMVGHMNSDTTKYYYLKDHLGSVRVVLNSTNTVVSAQDYDAWGYVLENRTYNNSDIKYDFTGKERDAESSYDYFGARYYDSRIGRWNNVEPKHGKFISYSTYAFSICNPINIIDFNGLDVDIIGPDAKEVYENLKEYSQLPLRRKLGKDGKVQLKKNAKVDISKLSEPDKKLYEAITSDKTVVIESVASPVFKRDNETYVVVGGTHGPISENVVTHFINLESADYYRSTGINTVGEVIAHEIIEGFLRISGFSQEGAHKEVIEKYITQRGNPFVSLKANEFGEMVSSLNYSLFGRQTQNVFSYDPKTLEIITWFEKK